MICELIDGMKLIYALPVRRSLGQDANPAFRVPWGFYVLPVNIFANLTMLINLNLATLDLTYIIPGTFRDCIRLQNLFVKTK